MNNVKYINNTVSFENNNAFSVEVSKAVLGAFASLPKVPGVSKTINFLISAVSNTASNSTVENYSITMEYIDENAIRLDGVEYYIDDFTDSIVTGAATLAAVTLGAYVASGLIAAATLALGGFTVAAIGVAATAAVGSAVNYLYSNLQFGEGSLSDATSFFFEQINGTIDVQFQLKDLNGTVLTTALHPDGLPEEQWQNALQEMFFISGEESFDKDGLVNGKFTIPTDGMTIEIRKIDSLSSDDLPEAIYHIHTNENPDGTQTNKIVEQVTEMFFNDDLNAFKAAGETQYSQYIDSTNGDIFVEKTLNSIDENNNPISEYHSWLIARSGFYNPVDLVELGIPYDLRSDIIPYDALYIPTPDAENPTTGFDLDNISRALSGNFEVLPESLARQLYLGDDSDTNELKTGAGQDWVFAGGGNDTVYGEGGNDWIYGDYGYTASYNNDGADHLYGGTGSDHVFGGGGDDHLYAKSGINGLEEDYYYGDEISGSLDGKDTLYYQDVYFSVTLDWTDLQNKELTIYQTSDLIYAQNNPNVTAQHDRAFSIERFYLTDSADHVIFDDLPGYEILILGAGGNDILDFTDYNQDLNITIHSNTTLGQVGNITFTDFTHYIGGAGNDTFIDGVGSHHYDGGTDPIGSPKVDIVDYSNSSTQIVVSQHLGIVNSRIPNSFDFEKDYITNIEGFVGTLGNDYFYVREGVQSSYFDGNGNVSYLNDNLDVVLGRDIIDFSYHDGNADDLIGPPNPSALAGININIDSNMTGVGYDTSGGTFTFENIEQVIATNGNDVIVATQGANWLFGLSGEDELSGGDGNDHLSGGGDNDLLDGGNGNDTYYFGWLGEGGIDHISDSNGEDKIYFMESHIFDPGAFFRTGTSFQINGVTTTDIDEYGESVVETIEFSDRATFDTAGLGLVFSQDVVGTGGNNQTGTTEADNIAGTSNDDSLYGDDGDDVLSAAEGNDLIVGGDGADTLNGGIGDDALFANTINNNTDDGDIDVLNGHDGNDFLYGSGGGDQLYGGAGYDYLSGKSGDLLFGGYGEDQLYGSGAVVLDGGDGNDYLSGLGAGVDYIFSAGTDVIFDQGSSSRLVFNGSTLENLTFGRAANNSLVITDVNGDRAVILNHFGNNPLEFLNFGASDILISNIDNDIVFFTPSVEDGSGNSIYPEHSYFGGDENNTYFSTGADDTVDVGLGQNNITFAPIDLGSRVFLFTTPDAEQDIIKYTTIDSLDDLDLTYENGVMKLTGGLDEVIIDGATENGQSDHIKVQVGSGQLVEEATLQELDLTIIGSASGDLNGYSIHDVMFADETGSIIDGLTGDDTITGLSGDDILYGGIGDDVITDGDGDDIVYGDEGSDILIDLGGDDTYYVDVNDVLFAGAGSNTVILDWDTTDEQNGIPYSLGGFNIVIDNEDDFNNIIFSRSFETNANGEIIGTADSYSLHYAGNSVVISDYEELSGTPIINLADTAAQKTLSSFELVTDISEFTDGEVVSEGALQFSHNDLFFGTAGNDTLSFTGGVDTIYGGKGNDSIQKTDSFYLDDNLNLITVPHTAADTLIAYGEEGDDLLFGGLGDDMLDGGIGKDIINGKQGNNSIYGGAGDDTLSPGSTGDNYVDGGDGNDTISFNPNFITTTEGVVVDLNLGTATSSSGIVNFENIENVEGTSNYDHIIGDNNDNILSAYTGDDLLEGKGGNDTYRIPYTGGMTIRETEGYDVIEAPLTIAQAQPALTITISGYDMLIDTGVGVYTIENQFGGDPNTRVEAIQLLDGTLDLVNYKSWYTVETGGEAITVSGTNTAEAIIGTDGLNDAVDYSLSTSFLTIDLEVGIGADGYAEGDTYYSIEDVIASAYNDVIQGSSELNNLYGGAGDDILSGGAGDDYLEGGIGNDIYIFNIGDGINTILETAGFDSLSLGVGITFGDITFNRSGDDLNINIASGFIVKDFYSGNSDNVVEQLIFEDGFTFDLTSLLMDTPESAEAINTASTGFSSYNGSQDAGGTINLIESATGVEINGNAWKKIALDYTITENTVISFEYKSTIEGEIQGFGLETDDSYTTGAGSFQLYGTDTSSSFSTDYTYVGAGDWQHFSIDIGVYQTGEIDWLTFVNDHDGGNKDATSFYRNIVLYERDGSTTNVAPQAVSDEFEGYINSNIIGNLLADNFYGKDFDVDGDPISVVMTNITTNHGSVSISTNGDFIYTPNTDFSGTDSFWYTVEDGQGGQDTVQATLYVQTTDADHTYTTSSAFEHYNGGAGTDTVDYSTSSTRVKLNIGAGIGWDGDANDDTYVHIENVIGTDLVSTGDTIYGSEAENYIRGLAGNDVLEGMGGADIIDGGAGSDYASYSKSDSGVIVNLETGVNTGGHAEGDTLISIEKIIGSDHNDILTGNIGSNIINAGKGDDILSGGEGNDTLQGDYGSDTYIYTSGHDTIDERGTETDTVVFDAIWSPNDVVISGNTLTLQNSTVNYISFDDINLIEVFQFDGYAPMDLATLQTFGAPIQITGTTSDDTFLATSASESFDGDIGSDTVDYSSSATRVQIDLDTGIGWDGDAVGDTYVHIENVIGSDIAGDRDFIYGSSADNYITGLAGNDVLEGMGGADTIDGGSGSDYANYIGSDEGVSINLSTNVHSGGHAEGDNLISIEKIQGSDYNDIIIGSSVDNTLIGRTGNDEIRGGDGSDYIYGGNGDDLIYGDAGVDMLYGDAGADIFIFEAFSAFSNSDNIQDFKLAEDDKLNVSDLLIGYDPLTDAITDFVQITENGSNSYLSVDADGGADNFVQVAYIYNANGLTDEDALETSGNLITV